MNPDDIDKMYCVNHPKRETRLRCNRCERPICTSCAVLTPTGYRCKDCVRGQQKIFDTAKWWDYPMGAATAFIISMLGSLFSNSFGFFAIIIAFGIGIGIVAAARFVLRRRRSRNMPLVLSITAFLGGLILHTTTISYAFLGISQTGVAGLAYLLWPIVYALVVAVTIYYRYKGIRI